MNTIKKIESDITELNTYFLLNLENYARVFYNTLIEPKNPDYKNDLFRKNNILQDIDSTALTLKNKMLTLIDTMSNRMNMMNNKIEKYKRENDVLKQKAKTLNKDALTADGLFDGELEWYREQVKIVVVMLIGIIIGTIMFKQMNLSSKNIVIALIIVIVLGTLFTKIATFFASKVNSYGNTMVGIQ